MYQHGHGNGAVMPIPGMSVPVGGGAAYQQPSTRSTTAESQQDYLANLNRQRSLNASSQANSAGRGTGDAPKAATGQERTPAKDTQPAQAPDPASAESFILRFSNRENEIYFTSGEIFSLLATKARRAKVSADGIQVQSLGGGRGPFQAVVSRALGELILDDEEIELVKTDPAHESVERSVFEVARLDAQGRVFDEGTKQRIMDVRRARGAERDKAERDRTYRFFVDGGPEMLLMMTSEPEAHKELFIEAVEYVMKRIPTREKYNFTSQMDDIGNEQNSIILFVVRPNDMSETDFLRQIMWSELKYAIIRTNMNPCKVRITRELSNAAKVKACCFMPGCQELGKFECGARTRAMDGIRLPSNFTFERDNAKRQRQASVAAERQANKKRMLEVLGESAKSPHVCRRYRQGRCTRHMFDLHQRPADISCEFTHGDIIETMQIPCKTQGNCEDMGCPYLHPQERQAKALDEYGMVRTQPEP